MKSIQISEFILLTSRSRLRIPRDMETLGVLILLILVPLLYQKKKRKPALETRVNSYLYSITQCLTDEIFIYEAPPVYLSQELAPCRNLSQLEPQTLIM